VNNKAHYLAILFSLSKVVKDFPQTRDFLKDRLFDDTCLYRKIFYYKTRQNLTLVDFLR
jgi:hypothetical protein